MRLILLFGFCFCTELLSAQFGIRLKAERNNYKDWDQVIANVQGSNGIDLFPTSYEVGIDYWLRLKNVRLEIYPELSFGLSKSNIDQNINSELPESYSLKKGGLGLNTHIYFLDFKGDCDCPTFSKQNGFIKKGLFLLISIKEYVQFKETFYIDRSVTDRDFLTQFGVGIGLDIGASDLLTITPFVTTSYISSSEWSGINANHGIVNILPPDETTSNLAFQVGLRLGFRPDYKGKN